MPTLDLLPNDLVVCVDETGSESLSDPANPFFGLGGCAVTGSRYIEALERPWNELKSTHFGGRPLHAAKIDPKNKAGIDALAAFFTSAPIARFCTVITTETSLRGVSTDVYQALALTFADQIGRVLKQFEYFRLVLAFEQSESGDAKVKEHFSALHPILAGPKGPFRSPVERCLIPKSVEFAAMEVADFVVHAAGGQARKQVRREYHVRPDFEAVFAPAGGRFAEVLFATEIVVRAKRLAAK